MFDDWFATVPATEAEQPDFIAPEWNQLFGESNWEHFGDDDDDDDEGSIDISANQSQQHVPKNQSDRFVSQLDAEFFSPTSSSVTTHTNQQRPQNVNETANSRLSAPTVDHDINPGRTNPNTIPLVSTHTTAEIPTVSDPTSTPVERPKQSEPSVITPTTQREQKAHHQPAQQREQHIIAPSAAPTETTIISPVRRSTRERKATNRLINTMDPSKKAYFLSHEEPWICLVAEFLTDMGISNPSVYKAATSDPDTYTYVAILNHPDIDLWKEAALKEITDLSSKGTWTEVPISEALSRILPGTWVFKLKRAPDGTPRKHKARYCVRGDLQEGEFDTFSPVIAWSSIRIILVLALSKGWVLVCVDFCNAFVQAILKDPIWIHLPRGFRSTSKEKTCLRLNKSLYGIAAAPRLWFLKLKEALLEDGFIQSELDQCLFMKNDMIVFIWVDDCGICAKTMAEVDDFIARLRHKGFELTKDSNFAEYLGIDFKRDAATQTITMTQPGLIKKIITATGMEGCNPNWVPALHTTLGSDTTGPPMDEPWNYSSIVGMMLYLSTNTRPDISFAVSQVARFSSNPKQSHATAVKTIVRYLARTIHQGTIFKPNHNFKLDCYVDADFLGLHGSEDQSNPTSAKSRTGYIVFFRRMPTSVEIPASNQNRIVYVSR